MILRIVIAFVLFNSVAGAQEPNFFVQISDTQLGMYSENQDVQQEVSNFEFIVANVNRLRPLFLINCGDLINKARDSRQTAEYLRVRSRMAGDVPYYQVAGNHDVGNEPTPESLAAYRKTFGPDYYSFRQGGIYGIVLDSNLYKAPLKAQVEAQKQQRWLEAELEKARATGGSRTVVFLHIPLFLETPDEPEQYFNWPLDARRRMLELLHRNSVEYVFAGHYHRNAFGRDGALQMTTTGPAGKPLGPDPSGMRFVQIGESSLQSQYVGLGNIPSRASDLTVEKKR